MIAVVVPAFNEADGLRSLLPRIPACLFGVPVQVIVVSDGSTDATEAVALDHGAVLVRLPKHRGKGAALRAGFAQAMELDPAQLVTMDADGQHDPADLERRKESLGEPGARLLAAGVTGMAGDVIRVIEDLASQGADTVYFHVYGPGDVEHIRLLGSEVVSRF